MDENIITLTLSDGQDIDFECADAVEIDGENYVVLIPVDEKVEGVVVMKEVVDENDPEYADYLAVEDDALFNAVIAKFKEQSGDEYEFVD